MRDTFCAINLQQTLSCDKIKVQMYLTQPLLWYICEFQWISILIHVKHFVTNLEDAWMQFPFSFVSTTQALRRNPLKRLVYDQWEIKGPIQNVNPTYWHSNSGRTCINTKFTEILLKNSTKKLFWCFVKKLFHFRMDDGSNSWGLCCEGCHGISTELHSKVFQKGKRTQME